MILSVIDYTKITGLKIEPKVQPKDTTVTPPGPGQAIYKVSLLPSFSVQTAGMQIQINGIKAGSVFGVYDIMGKVISSGIALSDNMNVRVPMAGSYIVRVGSNMRRVNVK